jgi:hypothetical protein
MTQSGPLSANQLHAPADGLSISHDVSLKQHGGSIDVDTQPGEFTSGPFCHTRLRTIAILRDKRDRFRNGRF